MQHDWYDRPDRPGTPRPAPPARRPDRRPPIRASDAEREEVAELLRRHHVDGRLDYEEFDQRMGVAYEARTRPDLENLLLDLPVLAVRRPADLARPAPAARRPSPLLPLLALLAAAATLFVGVLTVRAGLFWPLIPLIWLLVARAARRHEARERRVQREHRRPDHGHRPTQPPGWERDWRHGGGRYWRA